MGDKGYLLRLKKELKDLLKEPVDHIVALPKQNNILEWHYVIYGLDSTSYAGGELGALISFLKLKKLRCVSWENCFSNVISA